MGARKADAAAFHSERDQIAAMEEAVSKVGGHLHALPSELDVSGGLPLDQRPSLSAAVEGVEAGKYAGIVVAYQSRLGRDTEHEEAVWRRVEAAGGRIIMALDGLDTTTVDGKMVRRIRSAINHAERDRHVEKFANLREWATEAGIWQARQTPRGYSKDPETRKLVPNAEAENVRWAFRARAAGTSIVDIARRLAFTPSGVRQLLRNRVYLGELRVGDCVNPAAHDALIDVATFEAAQRKISRPPHGPREGQQARAATGPALLAGLVRCAGCGHIMSRGATKVPIYRCPANHSGEPCPAPAAITLELLDDFVERLALEELDRLAISASPTGGDAARAEAAFEKAKAELEAYVTAISAADVGAEAFAAGARQRSKAVDAARTALHAAMDREPADFPGATGGQIWEVLDAHERNQLLRGLLAAVVVKRGGGRGSRTPLVDRVRVLAHGFEDLKLPGGRLGGVGSGIVPIVLPDLHTPGVLRPPSGEDPL
jgi:DNA invertase Pin-like site-specific DNA recombinase